MATKDEKRKALKKHVEAKKKKKGKKSPKDLKNIGQKGKSFTLFGKKPGSPEGDAVTGGAGDNLGTRGVF
jgi:hypothetical protein